MNQWQHIRLRSGPENGSGPRRPFFQARLTVNQPNDFYEQEADHMADKVMRMSGTDINQHSFFRPADGAIQRKCQACEEEEKHVQRMGDSGDDSAGHGLDSYVGSLHTSGQPLPESSRQFFEPKFGRDFSNVRLHTDSVAAKSGQSVNALAYTSGNNIVFNTGQYSPETGEGKQLLAHELTHVVQQASHSGNVQRKIEVPAGTELDTMGFNHSKSGDVYTAPAVVKNSSVHNEIVTALLASGRTFKLAGTTNAEVSANFKKHIAARLGIIAFAAKKKYTFGAGANTRMNPNYWVVDTEHNKFDLKPGANRTDAINDLNVNPGEYAIACKAATYITMTGGSESAIDQKGHSSDINDWIPGDWGWIKNINPASNQKPGLEGENIIYAGKDKFWGHFAPGNTYDTLQGWIDEVNGFDGDNGTAELQEQRFFPTKGLL